MGSENALSIGHGIMKICFEFEENQLKTLLCGVLTGKKVIPQWPQMSLMGRGNVLGSGPWSNEHLV